MGETVTNKHNHDDSFDSRAIHIDLNGPITSIEAVVNNLPRADGRGEWEHLLGEPVDFTLTQKDFNTLQNVFESNLIKAGITENFSDNFNQRMQILVNTFQQQQPDLYDRLKISYRENLSGVPDENDRNNMVEGSIRSVILNLRNLNKISQMGGILHDHHVQSGPIILLTDPEITARQYAAGLMGVNEHEVPPHVPGSKDTWRASVILHELEHIPNQRFNMAIDAPHDIYNYAPTLREIDSDFTAKELLKPHVSPEFTEYRDNVRMIGTISDMVRLGLNDKDPKDGTFRSHKHATGHPLANLHDIRHDNYSIPNHLENLSSLTEKIRNTIGVGDGNKYIDDKTATFRGITEGVENLVARDTTARRVMNEHNSVEPLLSDEERDIAQQFLKAVDDVGFTAMWQNEATLNQNTMPPSDNNAPQNSGSTYKP